MDAVMSGVERAENRKSPETSIREAVKSADYTIAIITALAHERAAAIATLDERYDEPGDFEQQVSDTNAYDWGRVGNHFVVIASLPAGEYGTTIAATTAFSLRVSLSHIRIGLLVGIGAGIPRPDYDIRLGDVVVSHPEGTSGGVVQYDFVKAKDGHLERTGFLSMPPEALRHGLNRLKAEHQLTDSQIPQLLQNMVDRYPKLMNLGFTYQGEENDRFFKSSYSHVGGSNCDACKSVEEVQRPVRSSSQPQIHYGIVASGNRLIKDAAERDAIMKRTGERFLCFEMEAAGLMNTFPCLVIRGICDYADSHKNDQWQKYAAATAAAFAKELLLYVRLPDVMRAPILSDTMKDGEHFSRIVVV